VGSATGIGSLPGTDIAEAQKLILGELPDLPHLPELPDRGPGADMIGRSAGFLPELPVELYTGRWQVAHRPGRDLRRTADLLERDLDQLAEQAAGFTGTIKIQAVGPWTLSASIELAQGGPLLRDHGAARDLAASLAQGLKDHVAAVRRRLPGAQVLLQLDEPSLPAVRSGRVPTASGWGTLRAVSDERARDALRMVIDAVGAPVVVHCCAPDAPLGLLRDSGATGVSIDLSLLKDLDILGEQIDEGLGIFAGVIPTLSDVDPDPQVAAHRVAGIWRALGFPVEQLSAQVVITPACGLAGASQRRTRSVVTACYQAARELRERIGV